MVGMMDLIAAEYLVLNSTQPFRVVGVVIAIGSGYPRVVGHFFDEIKGV